MPSDRHPRPHPTHHGAATQRAALRPRRRPPARVLVVAALVVGLVATFAAATASAQQPDPQSRLAASRSPDRADPVAVTDLTVTQPVYVFADAARAAWVAFYVDLRAPAQLSEPDHVETQPPFDLAGTRPDGQAAPLDPATLGAGTHRITAIIGTSDGGHELVTGTIRVGDPAAPPSPAPTPTGAPAPSPAPTPAPLTTLPPTDPAEPSAPGEQEYGVHQDLQYGVRPGAIQAIGELGATISRSSLLWDKLQPEQGPPDWSSSDAFITQLTDAGIEPLLAIVGSPQWASGSQDRFVVPTDPDLFAAWVQQYAEFARAAAARYRDQVFRWELWNEPNEHFFWKPDPDPDRYRQWYLAVREAVLAGNPDAQVAVGGLSGLTASCCVRGLDFLARLLEQDTPIDAVAIHPYPGQGQAPDAEVDGENDFTDITEVHQLLTDAGRPEVPLWVTEWGWSSGQVGEQTQASYVADSIRLLGQEFPYVTVATYFLDHDRPEFDHGLLRADLTAKPAATAFAAAVRNPDDPPGP